MDGHRAWLSIALSGGLIACSAHDSPLPAAPSAAQLGARMYSGNCASCHQADARGIAGVYPSLVGSPVLLGDAAALSLWVLAGVRPASLPSGHYSTRMPQFGWMKAEDAAALLTYLRSNFGNAAPAVEAQTVAGALSP